MKFARGCCDKAPKLGLLVCFPSVAEGTEGIIRDHVYGREGEREREIGMVLNLIGLYPNIVLILVNVKEPI